MKKNKKRQNFFGHSNYMINRTHFCTIIIYLETRKQARTLKMQWKWMNFQWVFYKRTIYPRYSLCRRRRERTCSNKSPCGLQARSVISYQSLVSLFFNLFVNFVASGPASNSKNFLLQNITLLRTVRILTEHTQITLKETVISTQSVGKTH